MPQPVFPSNEGNHLSRNEEFLRKIRQIIQFNLANEQFGVEDLAEAMAMSRIQLYRKLQQLTRKNISQYIREYRLEKGMELLKENVAGVAEIAFRVGFSSSAYFSKCFHEFYGYPPGEVIKSSHQEELDLLNSRNKSKKETTTHNIVQLLTFRNARWVFSILTVLIILLAVSVFLYKNSVKDSFMASNREKSIAVLPFDNDSPDPENEYLCRGMEAEIRTQLMKINDLKIMSRQSVDKYQGENTRNLAGIGAELKVSNILTGSVRKVAENIRISVQLYDASTEKMIWADTYDGKYSDEIFKFQSDIAIKIASALNTIITPEEKRKLAAPPDIDITAYDYRLRASHEKWKYWLYGDTVALNKAERLVEKALKLEPDNVRGWLSKAAFYWDRYAEYEEYYEENYMDSVLWYCEKASQIDPESDFPMKGMVYHHRGDITSAVHYYKIAIENMPETLVKTGPLMSLGYIYLYNQEYQKGISLIRKAVQIAKGSPRDYGLFLYWLAYAYLWMGDYEEAENFYLQSREMVETWYVQHCYLYYFQGDFQAALDCSQCCSPTPKKDVCLYFLGNTYFQLGNFENAVKYYQQFRKVREARCLIQWDNLYREGIALIELGRKEEGMQLIEEQLSQLEKRKQLRRPDGYDYHLAAIAAYRGDLEKALQYLRNYENKVIAPNPYNPTIPIYFTRYDILFKPLWDHPGFKALLREEEEEKAAGRAQIRKMEKRDNEIVLNEE